MWHSEERETRVSGGERRRRGEVWRPRARGSNILKTSRKSAFCLVIVPRESIFFASLGLLLELTLELSASRAKSERTPYSRVQLAVRSDGYKSTMVSEC